MKKSLVFWAAALASMAVCAAVPHLGLNAIGDLGLVMLGEYAFSNPLTVDLAPTNAPDADGVYSVRCQIIYVDEDVQVPKDDVSLELLRQTGDWLTDRLREFIEGNYARAEFENLRDRYFEGAIGIDLDEKFPAFVRARMIEANLKVDVVKVQIFADGDLRRSLIGLLKAQRLQ